MIEKDIQQKKKKGKVKMMQLNDSTQQNKLKSSSCSLIDQLTEQRDEARRSAMENQEQLDVLMTALKLVSKLAAMDSDAYHLSHIEYNEIKSHDCQQRKSIKRKSYNERNIKTYTIQSELDSILQRWKLEETPLLYLLSSINSLHSQNFHTKSDADELIPQVHSLRHDIEQYKARNRKLENAVKKLYKNNLKSEKYFKDREGEHKAIVNNLRGDIENMKVRDSEELHLVKQVAMHEKIMQIGNTNDHNIESSLSFSSSEEGNNIEIKVSDKKRYPSEERKKDCLESSPLVLKPPTTKCITSETHDSSIRQATATPTLRPEQLTTKDASSIITNSKRNIKEKSFMDVCKFMYQNQKNTTQNKKMNFGGILSKDILYHEPHWKKQRSE